MNEAEVKLREAISGVSGISGRVKIVEELSERLERELNIMRGEVDEVSRYVDIVEENNALKRRLLLNEAVSMSKVRIKWVLGYRIHSPRILGVPDFQTSGNWYKEYSAEAADTREAAVKLITRPWRGVPGADFRIPQMIDAYIEPILYRKTSRGIDVLVVDDAGAIQERKLDGNDFKKNFHENIQSALRAVISRVEEYLKYYYDYLGLLSIWHADANAFVNTARAVINTHDALESPPLRDLHKNVNTLLEAMGETLDNTEKTNVVEDCT